LLCVLNDNEMIHQQISKAHLSKDEIDQSLHTSLAGELSNQRVLVLIPDHTRSLPLPMFFRSLVELLYDVKQLDFMVALGTHPATGGYHG
jgi:nickel-dependent lactate racemase